MIFKDRFTVEMFSYREYNVNVEKRNISPLCATLDFSCMVEIEVDNFYY